MTRHNGNSALKEKAPARTGASRKVSCNDLATRSRRLGNRNVDLGDEAHLTVLLDSERLHRDHAWWAAEAGRAASDWPNVVGAALEMMIAGGVLKREPDAITPWDAASWRQAAVEYHRDRSGRLAVELEPKRLARLRRLMADDVSLERAWLELRDNHSKAFQRGSSR